MLKLITSSQKNLKILFVVNDLGFFLSHRLPIALAAKSLAYDVHVVYGSLGKANRTNPVLQGLKLHYIPIVRGGTNPFLDLGSLVLLWVLFIRIRPNLIHLITLKPILYGGIAAHLARVPAVVSAIAGLGYLFSKQPGLKFSIIYKIVKCLFRWCFSHPRHILIFQNSHDRDQILNITNISLKQTRIIRGSGVDLTTCPYLEEPDGQVIISMASRLLREKGVVEFVEAARILRQRSVFARFWLIGEPDIANPSSITDKEIREWKSEGCIEYLGYCDNVPYLYAQSHIVVLPSYYREGLPKSLIEAAACGRPVVTTDLPGCRDAINPNVTGFLVRPRDSFALADVLECLIRDSELRKVMGKKGRELAQREFCIKKVVDLHLQIYHELLNTTKVLL